ncbi:MAG TPA: class I tRNA ligase family protein, partial [Candidatus Limnocylindria bacterium]|nr:class I tRNA ligase family protein [Candidatus Limnocylindria bacterium]
NFVNKLWNAARFVLGARPEPLAASEGAPTLAERWIASRLADAAERATRHLDELDLAGYAGVGHEVAWSDFCDWYLEMSKIDLRRAGASDGERARAWRSAAASLAELLRLLHPLMPFATETIWEALAEAAPEAIAAEPMLVTARWPAPAERDPRADDEFAKIRELTQEYREQRNEMGLPAGQLVPGAVQPGSQADFDLLTREREYVESLSRVRPLEILAPGTATSFPAHGSNTSVGVAWLVADGAAGDRRAASETELRERVDRLRALLGGPFAERAPAELVARERARLAELEAQLRLLVGD